MRQLFAFICLAAALAFAGPAAAQDNDFNIWAPTTATVQTSDDAFVHLEVQPRFTSDASRLGQLLLRTGLAYRLNSSDSILIGYGYILTDPVGPAELNEHRVFQQYVARITGDGKGFTLGTRIRLEERLVQNFDDLGWRLRLQLNASAPIADDIRAVVWAEPFISFNDTDWGQIDGLNIWRSFFGVSVPIADNIRVSPGYINQYVFLPGEDRIDHVVNIGLSARF